MPTANWTTVPLTPEYIHGAFELRQTSDGVAPHRLPSWAVRQANDPQISMMESQPSGVRIAFRTAATDVEVTLLRSRSAYLGFPARPDGVIGLVVNGEPVAHQTTSGGETTTIDFATGQPTVEHGAEFTAHFTGLSDVVKTVEIWLPHNETIEVRRVAANAPVDAAHVQSRPRWLHHGSSISQGSNATSPTDIWPVAAARAGGFDLRNLGFGGSALVDPFMARTIRDLPADIISVKLGINLVNTDLMRMRAFSPAVHGFLDTIRDGHPTTPLLVISPIHCAIHETTPGPGAFDLAALATGNIRFQATGDPAEAATGKLTLSTIRAELARIVAERQADDANLHYLDGLQLFGEADEREHPLPDALHPDAATHQLIATRFAQLAFADGGPLAR
jgi:hypothetical protein